MKKNKFNQSATAQVNAENEKDNKRTVRGQETFQNISDDLSTNSSCILGATRTVNGVLQVCMKDAFGDHVWCVEDEMFNSTLDNQS